LALILRRGRLFLALIPALLLFGAQYINFFLPNYVQVPESARGLRVLTFNLGSYVQDYDRVVALIRSANAEIVAVQEMLSPLASVLTTELADLYAYQALHPRDDFARGVGIFSQYPILEDMYLDQIVLGGQRTRISLSDEQTITLLNVHPVPPRIFGGFDSTVRSEEIAASLDLATSETNPLLLIGDFNITDQTEDYARITARYDDAFRESGTGFGFTFPHLARIATPLRVLPPFLRIDYVFFSSHWISLDAYVLPDHGGSDHYPLYAELALIQADVP
jgi:endonuclease/exonuclease/phosphatase (EEP) superfamily protein YafD